MRVRVAIGRIRRMGRMGLRLIRCRILGLRWVRTTRRWRVGCSFGAALPKGGDVTAMDFDALGPEPVEDLGHGSIQFAHPGQVLDMRFHEVELGGHSIVQF